METPEPIPWITEPFTLTDWVLEEPTQDAPYVCFIIYVKLDEVAYGSGAAIDEFWFRDFDAERIAEYLENLFTRQMSRLASLPPENRHTFYTTQP